VIAPSLPPVQLCLDLRTTASWASGIDIDCATSLLGSR
jgi:hypothetical protein